MADIRIAGNNAMHTKAASQVNWFDLSRSRGLGDGRRSSYMLGATGFLKRFFVLSVIATIIVQSSAVFVCWRFMQPNWQLFGTSLAYCAAALGMIGFAFTNGLSASSGVDHQVLVGTAEQFDRSDRHSALSLGLVLGCIAAVNGAVGLWLAGILF